MDSYSCCYVDEATLVRSAKYSLHDAAERGDVAAMEALVSPDVAHEISQSTAYLYVDLNARDNTGCTALHTSVHFRQIGSARWLISRGVKLSIKCNGTPLVHIVLAMASLQANHAFCGAVLADLLQANVDVASSDDLSRYCMHIAALHGLQDEAKMLWAHPPARERIDLSATDRGGGTALHTAAESRQHSMTVWLLSIGANACALDKVGDTPAHSAAKAGWGEGVALLRAAMADPLVRNGAGMTVDEVFAPVHARPSSAVSSPASSRPHNTLILTHADCFHHHTCGPIGRDSFTHAPPENVLRLDVLLNPVYGTLRAKDLLEDSSRAILVERAPPAQLSDVLRVHEYEYIRRILHASGSAGTEAAADPTSDTAMGVSGAAGVSASSFSAAPYFDPKGVHLIDADTAVSRGSWTAALRAAGAVCAAIDSVVAGTARTAFCPVRPPGHHAGPRGVVTSDRDPDGSHGFCLLNNVAIGAAYAMATYGRQQGAYAAEAGLVNPASAVPPRPLVQRVAIFDFDVHHGNGTEAILRALTPHEVVTTISLPFARAAVGMMAYKPWLDEGDGGRVMFVSTHGYGTKYTDEGKVIPMSVFYPGSGRSTGWDVQAVERIKAELIADNGGVGSSRAAMSLVEPITPMIRAGDAVGSDGMPTGTKPPTQHAHEHTEVGYQPMSELATPRTFRASESTGMGRTLISSEATPLPAPVPSLQPMPCPEPQFERGVAQPHIINVAMPHAGGPKAWRRAMTLDVLPRLAAFQPDLILVSAGFDAHKADSINSGYIRLCEDDYAWITRQLVKVANTSASGRVVSVLEGGYRVQGRIVSPFARSVASHVRALSTGLAETWDTEYERMVLKREIAYETEQAAQAVAAAEAAAAARAADSALGIAGFRSPRVNASGTAHPLGAGITPGAGAGAIASHVQSIPASPTVAGADTGRAKRRRVAVDYAALDAQLRGAEMVTGETPAASPGT